MIRRGSFLNKIIFIGFGLLMLAVFLRCNNSAEASTVKSEKISCGRILSGGDIQVYESVECAKEYKMADFSGNSKLYRKNVWLKKQFKKHVKENTYDIKSEIRQQFTFTYDKVGKVEITPECISQEIIDTGWKTSPVTEIYSDDDVCTVSNKYSVYEKNRLGNYQYMSDGYFDIFCDCNGNIGINSDVR